MNPRKPDFILCIPLVCLITLGLVMVRSASGFQSLALYKDPNAIFTKQLVALIVGLFGLLVLAKIPHDFYRRPAILYFAVIVVIGLLIGVKFQPVANGAQRWYYIGSFGFQPSDLAKVVLIIFTAAFSARVKGPQGPAFPWTQRLVPIIGLLTVFSILILWQPDFGTTVILIFIVGVMLFLGGLPFRFLALGGLLLLPLVIGLVVTEGYRMKRILDFSDKKEHYQITQSKIALGAGGLTGVGLGEGKQKLHYLPEAHTDFIFATIGEELGFIGSSFVLLMYLWFFSRGFVVMSRVESGYSQLLGMGLLVLLLTQALINISVTLDLFPNKGLTLPFLSAGGTSLMICLACCGILLNISRYQVGDNRMAT
ncbi:MAG: cell division protein FtsW [Acidobacteria bacterium]|nr:cell division protein FtsW [Acidobacteriota bacterium]MCB9396572.1 cell division protein FtsW [Acidobacteriota bacterium]